ncbi:MAG TPA: iron-containing alcohol dehydrogenase [Gemmatales bacterium]|nr:iron-containing alcohol dehydrogenase [Gemmatales bacterium]HMP60092.1 iron-containing alcohol dehydrogenase [Gemmatales bacterium]
MSAAVGSISLPIFDYQPLTRVVAGPGTLARLGELTWELGIRRVLLVTDPGLEEAGHPQRAESILQAAGLTVVNFDGVQENPTTRHVEAGLAVARAGKVDGIVAVGGGSSMDCAKGVNFLFTNGGTMRDYWGVGKASKPMLPSVGVPTTTGTGSEAQSFALICDPETHLKMACGDKKAAFKVAILDPELTLTQPERVAALTGLDALSHAVETYVTIRRSALSRVYAREAWRLLAAHFPRTLAEPDDLTSRAAMQWGAHLAGLAIENSMLGATHALANPLTAHYGMVHGQAIGLMLPHVVRFNAEVCAEDYADLADLAGIAPASASSPHPRALALADRLVEFARLAGLPTDLAECGVSTGMLTVLADEAAEQWTGKFNPRPVGFAELLGLYQQAIGSPASVTS